MIWEHGLIVLGACSGEHSHMIWEQGLMIWGAWSHSLGTQSHDPGAWSGEQDHILNPEASLGENKTSSAVLSQ